MVKKKYTFIQLTTLQVIIQDVHSWAVLNLAGQCSCGQLPGQLGTRWPRMTQLKLLPRLVHKAIEQSFKKAEREDTDLELSHHHFCHILLVKANPKPVKIQGLDKETSTLDWRCCKITFSNEVIFVSVYQRSNRSDQTETSLSLITRPTLLGNIICKFISLKCFLTNIFT